MRLGLGLDMLSQSYRGSASSVWDLDVFSSEELGFWFNAQNSIFSFGSGISGATEDSGNDLHLFQTTGSYQPTYLATGFNGLPCIDFDGAVEFLESTFSLTGNPEFSVMAVYKKDLASKGHLFGWGNTGIGLGYHGVYDDNSITAFDYAGSNFYRIPTISTDALILSDVKAAGAINLSSIHKNGILQSPISSSANTPNIQTGNLALGRLANLAFYFDGQIAEFAIWNKALSTDERQRAEGIFAHRWWRLAGLPVPLDASHPYYSSPPLR